MSGRHILGLSLLSLFASAQQSIPPASGTQAVYQAQARSAQQKFDRMRENASQPISKPIKTVLTEGELNAWLSSGQVQLPTGVKKVQFSGQSGVISTTAIVDFDAITANRGSFNPLLRLFTGTHRVEAKARGQGSGGQGQVHVSSVSLDGVEIPRVALEFFIDHYIKPKHPEVGGLDSTFKLPYKIDSAVVGSHELTMTQR